MILSNREMQKALDQGRLIIEPEPSPREPSIENPHCPYNTHSVDLKLHHEISVPTEGPFTIDLTQPGSITDMLSKHSKKYTLSKKQPYRLKKGEFILARTLEKIELSTSHEQPYLAARIEGKSSRARCGLLVHFTAPTVHPGFSGSLTLEMINLGPAAISLVPEMYIAQLIVEEVKGELIHNPSQFQDQTTPEGKQ